ncbi:MAG TPA: nucleoside-diphosphate kinase [Candidatus Kaiserbacteria bacterium]|nr:nucleoside-diphosphate kinase [Candidatus Kaiserbacteria bacterium]
MAHNIHKERTLIIVKPDGVQRNLIGEIIKRYENVGLKLVAVKMAVVSSEHIEKHYTLDPQWRRITGEKSIKSYRERGLEPPSENPLEITAVILEGLKAYMTSGPVVCMVWEGANAVRIVRKITGGTEPLTSEVGTIRGDYVLDSYVLADTDSRAVRNIIHASGSVDEAEMEIEHWFSPDEIIDYRLVRESVLYSSTLDDLLL